MVKIQRTTQKIFGGNAPADDIAALGSFKTGTPVYTDNIQALQNEAFEQGYSAALVANEAPFLEEQNSVPYVLSKQLAYLFQEGIPEYDANTTYYIGSVVKILNDNNIPTIYYSLTDDNIGNEITDSEHWMLLNLGGGSSSSGTPLPLGAPVIMDRVLDFEESKGFALQGTYVYKTGVAGSRYGYPTFVQRCLDEYQNSNDFIIPGNKINQPTFTSTTTDGITVSDSRNNTTNLVNIMNGTVDKTEIGAWSTYWINIDYGQPTLLNSYTIQADNGGTPEYPSAWTLQGSNDGENFTTIDTLTGQTFSLNQSKTFNISEQTQLFEQYRIVFSDGITNKGNGELKKVTFDASSGVLLKKNPNGHIFYDIADKDSIDDFFQTTGIADFYGVDEENERVFLPRNNWFMQLTTDTSKVNEYNEAGLPNITGSVGNMANRSRSSNENEALKFTYQGDFTSAGSGYQWSYGSVFFDASNSSSIYGNSDTVQPPSSNKLLYYVVGNTEQESAITDVTEITTSENDTIPLFAPMYFDFAPNNPSWLKAGQQANSGGIYTTVYNELVNELTTPKYELKVIETSAKVSGTDYSEYWEVNQDEMWFKTPTKISYKALSGAVIGNGQASRYYVVSDNSKSGILTYGGTLLQQATEIMWLVGAGGSNAQNPITLSSFPSESGYIGQESTAQLYFKVANAVENLELLDAGEVLETLADKVDITNTEWAASAPMPSDKYIDLTLSTSGATYTAPADGWVFCQVVANGQLGFVWLHTNLLGSGQSARAGTTADGCRCFVPVKKGQQVVVEYGNISSVEFFRFIYSEGAKDE